MRLLTVLLLLALFTSCATDSVESNQDGSDAATLEVSNNSIFTISPYKHNGVWVFDDSRVNLVKEPFVEGIELKAVSCRMRLHPRVNNCEEGECGHQGCPN